MTPRPGNWQLLNQATDPLPGDEAEVGRQAARYAALATTISDQISRLRQLSNGEAKGQYVEGLEQSALEIAENLSFIENRFETAAEQLRIWEPALSEGLRTSWNLLGRAEEADHQRQMNRAIGGLSLDCSTDQQIAEQQRADRYLDAEAELASLVNQLDSVIGETRSIAAGCAARITEASQDQVTDSWWDSTIRRFIYEHAEVIAIIARVLQLVAVAAAVLAFIFATGGFGGGFSCGVHWQHGRGCGTFRGSQCTGGCIFARGACWRDECGC